jgi:hypothetical protein
VVDHAGEAVQAGGTAARAGDSVLAVAALDRYTKGLLWRMHHADDTVDVPAQSRWG